MTAEAMIIIDKRKGELIMTGSNEQVMEALQALYESNNLYAEVTIVPEGVEEPGIAKLKMPGNRNQIKNAIIDIYNADLIECNHEFTEMIGVDDTRWLAPDGVHARSNPDVERCEICGAWFDPDEEEWHYD